MKQIYGGVNGAFKLENSKYSHQYRPLTVVTTATKDEVKEYFLSLACEWWPESEGYYGHYSSVVEVTESQIEDYLENR